MNAPQQMRGDDEGSVSRLDEQFVADARAAQRLALDTEFVGEGRYRTLLCLIQLAVPSADDDADGKGKKIVVLDPLADDFDGAALASLLADPAVEIVVHAGRQ